MSANEGPGVGARNHNARCAMSRIPDYGALGFDDIPDAPGEAPASTATTETPEGVTLHARYTRDDLDGVSHLGGVPGVAPFVRGPYPTMYVQKPWTCGSTQASPRPRTPTRSTAATSPRGRWA
jgi:hypothetical protein